MRYTAQARHGDELAAALGISETRSNGFGMVVQLQGKHAVKPVATVYSGLVFFDYARQRVTRMPEAFRAMLANAENSRA